MSSKKPSERSEAGRVCDENGKLFNCDSCDAPVMHIATCVACGETYATTTEAMKREKLQAPAAPVDAVEMAKAEPEERAGNPFLLAIASRDLARKMGAFSVSDAIDETIAAISAERERESLFKKALTGSVDHWHTQCQKITTALRDAERRRLDATTESTDLHEKLKRAEEDKARFYATFDPKLGPNTVVLHLRGVPITVGQIERWWNASERIETIADESFGPFPTGTDEENLSRIEKGIFGYHRELSEQNIRINNSVDLLRATLDQGGLAAICTASRRRINEAIAALGGTENIGATNLCSLCVAAQERIDRAIRVLAKGHDANNTNSGDWKSIKEALAILTTQPEAEKVGNDD